MTTNQEDFEPIVQSLPIVYCKGSHYDVGFSIGHTFAKRITDWFDDPVSPLQVFRKFYKDPEGHGIVQKYMETGEKYFPDYVQEIRGIADGSEAEFEDVFLTNLWCEIFFAHKELKDGILEKDSAEGCTSVYVNKEGMRIIGHNEDAAHGSERFNYLAHVTVVDEEDKSTVKENFITFMYPGMIPGFAFNVTNEFVITGNVLLPKSKCPSGVPLNFVLRKLLSCKTIEEMVEAAKCEPTGCAYGFNLNIASIEGTEMWSLEILPGEKGTEVSLHAVPIVPDESEKCHYFHQNFYKHIRTDEIPLLDDTIARGKRCDEMPPPRDEADVRRILGDQGNKSWPIYKEYIEGQTSGSKTVCTAVFNILDRNLHVYLDNPQNNPPFSTYIFPTLEVDE